MEKKMLTGPLILISLIAVINNIAQASTTVPVSSIVPVDDRQNCDKKTIYEQSVPFGNGRTLKARIEHMEMIQRICVVKGATITAAATGSLKLHKKGKFMISDRGFAEINGTLSVTNYLVIKDGRLLIAPGADVYMQTGTNVVEGFVEGEANFGTGSKVTIISNLVVDKGGFLNVNSKSQLTVAPMGELEVSNVMFGEGRQHYYPQYNLPAVLNCLEGCNMDLNRRSAVKVSPGGVLTVNNAEVSFKPGTSVNVQGEMEVVNGTTLSLSGDVLVTYGNKISFAGQHSVVIVNSHLTVMYENSGLYFRSDARIESKVIYVKQGAHCLFDPDGDFSADTNTIFLLPTTNAQSFKCYASKEELIEHL